VKQQALFRNPDRSRDRSVLREADKHNVANLIAAEVILESPERYGGAEAAIVCWATTTVRKAAPLLSVEHSQ